MAKQIKRTFRVHDSYGKREFTLRGRGVLILSQLIDRGPRGLTALDLQTWTTRLANYIAEYRNKYNLEIETLDEKNTGQFGGVHGRYILHTVVRIDAPDNLREAA